MEHSTSIPTTAHPVCTAPSPAPPKNSPDRINRLDSLLERVIAELALIINENEHTIEAAGSIHGMIEQATDSLGKWYIVESGKTGVETEVSA